MVQTSYHTPLLSDSGIINTLGGGCRKERKLGCTNRTETRRREVDGCTPNATAAREHKSQILGRVTRQIRLFRTKSTEDVQPHDDHPLHVLSRGTDSVKPPKEPTSAHNIRAGGLHPENLPLSITRGQGEEKTFKHTTGSCQQDDPDKAATNKFAPSPSPPLPQPNTRPPTQRQPQTVPTSASWAVWWPEPSSSSWLRN